MANIQLSFAINPYEHVRELTYERCSRYALGN